MASEHMNNNEMSFLSIVIWRQFLSTGHQVVLQTSHSHVEYNSR
jgi:hypothetical protein